MEKAANKTALSNQGNVNIDKLYKSFGKSDVNQYKNIPNEVGHSKVGPHTGIICEHLPSWAQEQGLNRALVLNRYKTIKFMNSLGYQESKTVFDGFYIFTDLGEDSHGRPVKDMLRFYDDRHNGQGDTEAMTFEKAIENIDYAAKHGVEPIGPARKLWAIAIENGYNHPLEMFQHTDVDEATGAMSYPKIKYAQVNKSVKSRSGRTYNERLVVSLAYYNSREDKSKSSPKGDSKPRLTNGNYYANHNKQLWNKAFAK